MIQTLQEQIHFLEIALKGAHTYKSVLSLKNDISRLIIAFNKLNKSSIDDLNSLEKMKMSIQNIRDQYKIKIQALKNPKSYPLVLYTPDDPISMDDLADYRRDVVLTSKFDSPPYVCHCSYYEPVFFTFQDGISSQSPFVSVTHYRYRKASILK